MRTSPLPPVAAVVSFIDCINRGDVQGLRELMTDDHQLVIFTEAAVVGRESNVDAWHGYANSFPAYVIYPHLIAERDGLVAVVGHTTGSHLGLPDDRESKLTLIWLAEVIGGKLRKWQLIEDNADSRRQYGLE